MNNLSHDFIQLQFRNSKSDKLKVIELYKKGLSLSEIRLRFNITKSVARKILVKDRVPLRNFIKDIPQRLNFHFSKRGTKPPYGFWYVDGCLVRHPKEYPVLLMIINQWQKGQPLNAISTELNFKKIPSPMHKKWSWNSVANIIQRIKSGQLVKKGESYELR